MLQKTVLYSFLLAICLVGTASVQAQTKSDMHQLWMTGSGMGIGTAGEHFPNAFFAVSYQRDVDLYSARLVMSSWIPLHLMRGDLGLLCGKTITDTGMLRTSASIGVAVTVSGRDEEKVWIGVPIQTQFIYAPFSFFGIGLYGFGNLNIDRPFAGLMLAFHFGDVR